MAATPVDAIHDSDAERAVLAAVLLDPAALVKVAGKLCVDHFYLEPHRPIYRACLKLHEQGRAADLVTVTDYLRQQGDLERVGGASRVSDLVDSLPDVANVVHYAEIVIRSAVEREIAAKAADLVRRPNDLGAAEGMRRALSAQSVLSGSDGFPVVSFGELARADLPEREPLIAPWLNRRELAMIYGARGTGKTYLALSLAIAAATAKPVLGWYAPEPVGVLYVDGEMNAAEMRLRVAALSRAVPNVNLRLLGRNLRLLSREYLAGQGVRVPYFTDPKARERFVRTVAPEVSLVILDNLSCLFGGEENDSAAWDPALEMLLRLKHGGAAVILLHHPGKGGDQRGTSRREDALDVSLKLEVAPGEGELAADGVRFRTVWAKHRAFRLAEASSLVCSLDVDREAIRAVWTYEEAVDARIRALVGLRSQMLAEKGHEPTVRDLEQAMCDRAKAEGYSELRVSRGTIHNLLKRAKATGLLDDDTEGSRPTSAFSRGPLVRIGQTPPNRAIWGQFVQQVTQSWDEDTRSVQVVQRPSPDNVDKAVCPDVQPPFKGWTVGQPTSWTDTGAPDPAPPDESTEQLGKGLGDALPECVGEWPSNAKRRLRELRAGSWPKDAAIARVRETCAAARPNSGRTVDSGRDDNGSGAS